MLLVLSADAHQRAQARVGDIGCLIVACCSTSNTVMQTQQSGVWRNGAGFLYI